MFVNVPGSFRDPSGRVFDAGDTVLRTIQPCYREHWEQATESGLLSQLVEKGFLLEFKEVPPVEGAWKCVQAEKLPFISYPYEWSFPQLRDAALLTLEIQRCALNCGMTLKDASAYNVQFRGSRPVFIDLLSFEKRPDLAPWQAYRQFCMHFLAPLALQSFEPRLSRLSAQWINGIPLDVAWGMLPARAKFSAGLQMHVHLHAKAEKRFEDGRVAALRTREVRVSSRQLLDVVESLERTIKALPYAQMGGEWSEYYSDTNYSKAGAAHKERLVAEAARSFAGRLAHDFGANTGRYSRLLAPHFDAVLASDLDAVAVARHYTALASTPEDRLSSVLPLVVDLANPSPAIGWACLERQSFVQRGSADMVIALALTHHLFFASGIPWAEQAAFFASLLKPGGGLAVEFVPRGDSQVERLLAARDDVFTEYTLEDFRANFGVFFQEKASYRIMDSQRVLLILTTKKQDES